MAKELGMEFITRLNFTPRYSTYSSPYKSREFIKKQTGFSLSTISDPNGEIMPMERTPCYNLWMSPQINWDGKFMGCGCNRWSFDYGNVFETSLREQLKGEKFKYTKRMLLGKEKPRDDIPCVTCHHYKNRQLQNMKSLPGPKLSI